MKYELVAFVVTLVALALMMYYVPMSQLVLLPSVIVLSGIVSATITYFMSRTEPPTVNQVIMNTMIGAVGGILLAQLFAVVAIQPTISTSVPVALMNAMMGSFIGSSLTALLTAGEISGQVSTTTILALVGFMAVLIFVAVLIAMAGMGPLVVYLIMLLVAIFAGRRLGFDDREILIVASMVTITFLVWQIKALTVVPIP
ncbi:MAG: hypothetical protein DRO39_05260 [Thermoprotei archaeon]|nr:MAG: hypothetical protein DRO39_05260 [Thermoprotei archaeon]